MTFSRIEDNYFHDHKNNLEGNQTFSPNFQGMIGCLRERKETLNFSHLESYLACSGCFQSRPDLSIIFKNTV